MDVNYAVRRIERNLPGWNWLVRSDDECRAYFANITSPDFQGKVGVAGEDLSTGMSFKSYAPDPAEALHESYLKAMQHLCQTSSKVEQPSCKR